MNKIKEKILLLLLGGIAFGYSITPGQRRRVSRAFSREWKKLNPQELKRSIVDLYRFDLIDKQTNGKGFFRLVLTEKGKLRALNLQLESIKNKKEKWDGKWRMVAFDVPEKLRRGRDALRQKLKKIGFCELQKSVLVAPYNCQEEIASLVRFFNMDKYVRFGVLEFIDNENYLKKVFKLI